MQLRQFIVFLLCVIGSFACLTCPVETFTTTTENFNASVPTSIVVESNYHVNLIVNYKNDIDQISIVLREGVNSMDECATLTRPSLYFNSAGGFILLNVFGLEADIAPQGAAHDHEHDHEHDANPSTMVPSSPSSGARTTKMSSIFINLIGIVSFFVLFQRNQRMSFLILGLLIVLLPFTLSHSECGKGRLTMQINVPASANIKFIRVHSEGQSVCMDPSGNNCGDDGSVNPCSSIYCINGGVCDRETAECVCPSGFTGAACEKPVTLKRQPTETNETNWTDSKGNYSLVVDVAPCDQPKGNFSVRFESSVSLEYAILMYQFASKCDTSHCDCSSYQSTLATDESNKIFTAVIPGSGKPEKDLYIYALYKSPEWNARHQYPEDALPHKFIQIPIGCDGVDGPCNPGNCWIALGQKGCSV